MECFRNESCSALIFHFLKRSRGNTQEKVKLLNVTMGNDGTNDDVKVAGAGGWVNHKKRIDRGQVLVKNT